MDAVERLRGFRSPEPLLRAALLFSRSAAGSVIP